MSMRSVRNNFWCSGKKAWFIAADFANVFISYVAYCNLGSW